MRKILLPALAAIMLLASNAYAAVTPVIIRQDDHSTITVIDITPNPQDDEKSYDAALPAYLPADVQIATEDGVKLLVKTYETPPDVNPQKLVEQNPMRNGVEYTLREILKRSMPSSTDSKKVTQTVTATTKPDKPDEIIKVLSDSIEYSGDGYSGLLYLDAGSISVEVESTKGYAYTVRDTKAFYGLDRNDPSYIPKTIIKNGATLRLTDIKWSPSASENLVSPTYSATAFYAGKASGQTADAYLVTAQYTGHVTKDIPGNSVYTIVYEPVAVPIPEPVADESVNWGKFAIIVISAGTIATGAVILYKRRHRFEQKVSKAFPSQLPHEDWDL